MNRSNATIALLVLLALVAAARAADEAPPQAQAAPATEKATPAAEAPKAESAALTAEQIVAKANFVAFYQGADGRARVAMTIVDDQGRQRKRELTILRRDEPDPADKQTPLKEQTYTGKQKFYVYFHQPADVNRMSYLVWKNIGADDDRWLYLPGVDLVKRVAGSEKRTSFVGSEFFYEDISGRNPELDTHELVETTADYYVLRSRPKDPAQVEFASYRTWIHKATFVVVRQEYYDEKDQPYRRYDLRDVKQISGCWITVASRMTNLRDKRYTDLVYTKVSCNLDIPEEVFTERYLRMPPDLIEAE